MKDKIIEVIKEFRAVPERHWDQQDGYKTKYLHGISTAYTQCADRLEELLQEMDEHDNLFEILDNIKDTAQDIEKTVQRIKDNIKPQI